LGISKEESESCEFYNIGNETNETRWTGEIQETETPADESKILPISTIENFISNIFGGNKMECSEWSECETDYNPKDIFNNNVLLKGVRKRLCKNSFDPSKNFYETKDCLVKNPITIRKSVRCSSYFLEAYDENNNLVSRLELVEEVEGVNNKLNIDFILDNSNYCDYCYDGIKDFDENETDCSYEEGKSCPLCDSVVENEVSINANVVQDIYSVGIDSTFIFLLLIFILLITIFILINKNGKNNKNKKV
jgi:hypothetical protein